MKNLLILTFLLAASAAFSQTIQFNGFPQDHSTGQRLKGFTLEVYRNDVLVTTEEVRGKKVKLNLEGPGQFWVRISKEGYEDFFFGSDLSNAPATQESWKLDLPCELFIQGTGKAHERLCAMMVYRQNKEMGFDITPMTYGELRSKLKI